MLPSSSQNYQQSLSNSQSRQQTLAPNGPDLDRPGARQAVGRNLLQATGAPPPTTPLQPQGDSLGAFHAIPTGHPLRHIFAGMGAQMADNLHPLANGGQPAPAQSLAQQLLAVAHGAPASAGLSGPGLGAPQFGSDRVRALLGSILAGNPGAQSPVNGGITDGNPGGTLTTPLIGPPGVATPDQNGNGGPLATNPIGPPGVVTAGGNGNSGGLTTPFVGPPGTATAGGANGNQPSAPTAASLANPASLVSAASPAAPAAAAPQAQAANVAPQVADAQSATNPTTTTPNQNNQAYADLINNMLKGKGRNPIGTRRALMQLSAGNAYRANGPLWQQIAELQKEATPGYYNDSQRAAELAPRMQALDDQQAAARAALIKDLAGRGMDSSSGAGNAFATLDANAAAARANQVSNLYQQEQQRQQAAQGELLNLLSGLQGRNAGQAESLANAITQFKLQQQQIDAANNPMNLLGGLIGATGTVLGGPAGKSIFG